MLFFKGISKGQGKSRPHPTKWLAGQAHGSAYGRAIYGQLFKSMTYFGLIFELNAIRLFFFFFAFLCFWIAKCFEISKHFDEKLAFFCLQWKVDYNL